MKFGEKVRDLRKKHSLTQDELAQCLGINKRTIIGWERDGRYPRSIEMLEKMAADDTIQKMVHEVESFVRDDATLRL